MELQDVNADVFNLITTPIALLPSLGLTTSVGLSSTDPQLRPEHRNKSFKIYLSKYSPDGEFISREEVGLLGPDERKLIRLSDHEHASRKDSLVVAHRVPLDADESGSTSYHYFRSVVEYSTPTRANGSVIYESPPYLNAGQPSKPPSTTLTFTTMVVRSAENRPYCLLIHHSMNPAYAACASYQFGLLDGEGKLLHAGAVDVKPFTVQLIDLEDVLSTHQGPLSDRSVIENYSFVGLSDNASLIVLFINLSKNNNMVAVEHTHAPRDYLSPPLFTLVRGIKDDALRQWKSILGSHGR